jgi:hypothetical protein
MKHTATAVIVALPLVCTALAVAGGSPPTGVSVSQNRAPYGELDRDDDFEPASGPGTYQASMDGIAGISANLIWGTNNSSSFVGACYGSSAQGGESTGISQTTMQVNLLTQSTFAITYDMSQIVRARNQIIWGLFSVQGDPAYVLAFDGTTSDAVGGVSTNAADTFTGTVSAGTYLLVMLAECDTTGGTFSYDATFTPVPAPGAIPAILMAAALRGRRRR